MFPYTTPLHVVCSIIVQRVVSKYGSLAVSCFCRWEADGGRGKAEKRQDTEKTSPKKEKEVSELK